MAMPEAPKGLYLCVYACVLIEYVCKHTYVYVFWAYVK